MKKICFVLTAEFAVSAFMVQHLKKLSEKFDVTVIVNTNNPNFLNSLGISGHLIPLEITREISLKRDFSALLKLINIFRVKKFDAVHTVTPKAGLLGILAAFLNFVPLRVHTFTGQVWANKEGFKKILLKAIDKFIGMLSTFTIIDSKSQQDFLVDQKILCFEKSIVFGSGSVSGVDLKKFKANKKIRTEVRSNLSIPDDGFVFIYLGRLNKDKGVLDLAIAFSSICDDKAYLLVVGPDEANFAMQMQDLSAVNKDRVRFVGLSREPNRYLAASDVLCLPSYREGFGSVVIEAAAIGVPAIVSNIYGLSDAVQNKITGLLHQPKDPKAILGCMNFFLLNPIMVKKYGLAAKKRAVIEFDSNILSQYWLDFYLSHIH